GIRDFHVTGVQTCALPIVQALLHRLVAQPIHSATALAGTATGPLLAQLQILLAILLTGAATERPVAHQPTHSATPHSDVTTDPQPAPARTLLVILRTATATAPPHEPPLIRSATLPIAIVTAQPSAAARIH